MESKSFSSKIGSLSGHLPSFLLTIGYSCFWFELYVIRRLDGTTSPLAYCLTAILALVFGGFFVWKLIRKIKSRKDQTKNISIFCKFLFFLGFLLIGCIFFVVIKALTLPPHFSQEFDALNYHMTLPRQHLILGSFSHIGWSSADLFPLPVQFALAPYWLVSNMPNKFIHIFFIIGLIVLSCRVLEKISFRSLWAKVILVFAIMGSHGLGIQMPTAMLDLIFVYLLLAVIDSLLERKFILAAIEAAFLFWAKSFFPMLFIFILILMVIITWILRRFGFKKIILGFNQDFPFKIDKQLMLKCIILFFIASIVIAGPFIVKSMYYSGSPLYPFFANSFIKFKDIPCRQGIIDAGRNHFIAKNMYGAGRSSLAFLQHIFILAVPERGVNNRFDYPLGLPYLLFLALFLISTISLFKRKVIGILPLFILVYWISWWFGSQQARFLFMPLVLSFIVCAGLIKENSKVFLSCLLIAVFLNCLSIARANLKDFNKPLSSVIRKKDIELLDLNKDYIENKRQGKVTLDFYDVAFARFPVTVSSNKNKSSPWVIFCDRVND